MLQKYSRCPLSFSAQVVEFKVWMLLTECWEVNEWCSCCFCYCRGTIHRIGTCSGDVYGEIESFKCFPNGAEPITSAQGPGC